MEQVIGEVRLRLNGQDLFLTQKMTDWFVLDTRDRVVGAHVVGGDVIVRTLRVDPGQTKMVADRHQVYALFVRNHVGVSGDYEYLCSIDWRPGETLHVFVTKGFAYRGP